MKCRFYGQYEIVPSGELLKAKCPMCGAIRKLQKRSGGQYFFYPHHEVIEGDSTYNGISLVFVSGRFQSPRAGYVG